MIVPAYAAPLRVGVSEHLTLCTPSPSTTSMSSGRLLKTTTSIVWPLSVARTLIFSVIMIVSFDVELQARSLEDFAPDRKLVGDVPSERFGRAGRRLRAVGRE